MRPDPPHNEESPHDYRNESQSDSLPTSMTCARRSTSSTPRSWQAVKRRTEVSRLIGKARMASGGTRLVHSREMKVIERYSELGPDGKDLAMLLLRLGRGRLGH